MAAVVVVVVVTYSSYLLFYPHTVVVVEEVARIKPIWQKSIIVYIQTNYYKYHNYE